MNKIAIITDTHFGVRDESIVFLDKQEEMLKAFFADIKQHGITEVWHLGDFFDNRKHISSKLLQWVRTNWVDVVESLGLTVRMIAGNHDTHYKSTNTPNTIREILGNNSNHVIIDNEPICTQYGTKSGIIDVAFVPWISPSNSKQVDEFLNKKYNIVLGHFDIVGALMQGSMVSTHGLDKEQLKQHDLVFSGHYHKKSDMDNIRYLGNPVPTTWAESPDAHGWHIFDLDTMGLSFKVFDNNLYQRILINTKESIERNYSGAKFVKVIIREKNEFHYQNFLEYLRGFEITQLTIVDESVESTFDDEYEFGDDLRDDLLQQINDYIDSTVSDNQTELKELMKLLYESRKGKIVEV